MTDYMTAPIAEVVKAIIEDGIIDATEVEQLRKRLYTDGKIDKEEAEALFAINDAVARKNNAPEWRTLFVEAICDFLLKDDDSLGVVDADEAAWLIEKIEGDGDVDDIEKFLLKSLKENAKELDPGLRAKLKDWGV